MSVCELLAKPEAGRDAGVIPCTVEGISSCKEPGRCFETRRVVMVPWIALGVAQHGLDQ